MASKVIIDIIANDKASGITSGITSTLTKLSTALLAIGTAGAAAFLALGKQALDATAEYEKLTLTMESLVARELKAADSTLNMADALAQAAPRAQELLQWIEKLAIQSPFDQEGVATAYRTALAYGFTSEAAQRLTQNMIDFASGTGQSVAVMNQVALALGQVRARGKLTGQEILQLVNAGVAVNPILEDMGYTLDDVSKGLVSADEFLEAFNLTMEEDFAGAAKRATASWSGLLSSLGDIKKIGLRTLFAETFEVLQPLVAKFAEWLQSEEGVARLKEIGAAMGDITQSIVDMASGLSGMSLEDFVSAIGDGAVALTDGFKRWAEGIDWNEISNQIADGIASVDWAGLGEQVRIAATNIFDGIRIAAEETDWAAMFSSATTAFLDFMAGLTGQESWENVKTVWASNFDQFSALAKNKVVQHGAAVQLLMSASYTNAMTATATTLAIGGANIISIINSWIQPIHNLVISLKNRLVGEFDQMIKKAISIIERAQDTLVQAIIDLISMAKSALKPINVIVNLPDFESLAREIEEGMAMLNAAMSGGVSAGVKGSNRMGLGAGQNKKGRAMGGRIGAGEATLVGERGAEIFVPDTGGKVIPNYKLGGTGGGNIYVNLTYAPAFSTVDQYELQERLAPFIERGIRNVQRGTA